MAAMVSSSATVGSQPAIRPRARRMGMTSGAVTGMKEAIRVVSASGSDRAANTAKK
jgi:hypothetical protein